MSCRGFDDRIGAFAMCEAFIDLANGPAPACNVHFAATVAEEIGLVGGTTVVYDVKPDIGICSDVTFATDANKEDRKTVGDVRLGRGPALACGPTYHKALARLIASAGDEEKIPYQMHPSARGTGNNGWAMRMQRGGCPTSVVAVPLRYMHSPVEVIDLDDAANTAAIVAAAVRRIDDFFPFLPEQP